MTGAALRVLLVEDDRAVREGLTRLLARAGFAATSASTVAEARQAMSDTEFDVIVTDIQMPGENGLQLLEEARRRDADLPVILVTAVPQLESAMLALNLGAYRYLTKPVDPAELERLVRRAGLIRSFALLKRRALEAVGAEDATRLDLDQQLDRSIDSLWMAWQPIVRARGKELLGFEALIRTDNKSLGRPDELLAASHRLNRNNELGRAVRRFVAARIEQSPPDATHFINLLPSDLLDADLVDVDAPLTRHAPRLVLEITERATLDTVPNLPNLVRQVRELGFRLAVDDLGAGYSGLTSITQLEPDFVKLDMSLVRGIHESTRRQAVVHSMVELCRTMGVKVIAEGIEVREEAEALWAIGVEYLQGYFFGKPAREMAWSPLA